MCYKKGHISCFYNSCTFLNKEKTSKWLAVSSFNSKKNISCIIQVIANKIFKIDITQKIIADSNIMQYLITNWDLICNYYDNYLEYQIRFGEVLPLYKKNRLFLPLDNRFLKLIHVWYAPDLGFNLISTIQFGEKGIEMWLWTIDQLS